MEGESGETPSRAAVNLASASSPHVSSAQSSRITAVPHTHAPQTQIERQRQARVGHVRDTQMSSNPQLFRAPDSMRQDIVSTSSSPVHHDPSLLPNMEDQGQVQAQLQPDGRQMSAALPADDGMHSLRLKMLEIHNLAASTEEKAQRMHAIMTQDYLARRHQVALDKIPLTPRYSPTAIAITTNPYSLTSSDVLPTFHPEEQGPGDLEEDEEEPEAALGCIHYKRNVKVQCYDCHLWFTCRHCHDASPNLPFPHILNRMRTENMLCMLCQTPQPAGEVCIKCAQDTAYYYCSKCKLWDNDSTKSIYHCDDCGICRRGEGLGKDYVHCKRCNVCISISTSDAHPCIERATDCDCPLCLDHLFSSTSAVVSLMCGHYMHATCYKDLMNVTYRCPVCNKSAVNMELQWRKLDDEIRMQPMPDDDYDVGEPEAQSEGAQQSQLTAASTDITMAAQVEDMDISPPDPSLHSTDPILAPASSPPRPTSRRRAAPKTVWIGCNDCGGRSWTPFHWLGLKCSVCDGYNTNQMTPGAGNAGGRGSTSQASVPGMLRQRQHDFTGMGALRGFTGNTDVDAVLDAGEGVAAGSSVDSGYGGSSAILVSGPEPVLSTEHAASGAAVQQQQQQQRLGRSYFLQAERQAASSSSSATRRDSSSAQDASLGPHIGTPRFLPYDFLQSLSRSLSPMRYYLEGSDTGADAGARKGEHSDVGVSVGVATGAVDTGPGKIGGRGGVGLGARSGDAGRAGGEEEDEESEDDDEDDDSAGSDFDAMDAEIGDEMDEMELFGHR